MSKPQRPATPAAPLSLAEPAYPADLRVEAYGAVDELNATLGFARSICSDEEIAGWTEQIQKTALPRGRRTRLFARGRKSKQMVLEEDVEYLTGLLQDRGDGGNPRGLVFAGGASRVGRLRDRPDRLPSRGTELRATA